MLASPRRGRLATYSFTTLTSLTVPIIMPAGAPRSWCARYCDCHRRTGTQRAHHTAQVRHTHRRHRSCWASQHNPCSPVHCCCTPSSPRGPVSHIPLFKHPPRKQSNACHRRYAVRSRGARGHSAAAAGTCHCARLPLGGGYLFWRGKPPCVRAARPVWQHSGAA
jgi:hypothetical protein